MIENRPQVVLPAPPILLMSTDDACPGEELDYWREATRDVVYPMNFERLGEGAFRGDMAFSSVGDLGLADVRVSPNAMERNAACVSAGGDDIASLFFVMSGSMDITGEARRPTMRAGTGAFDNGARPFFATNRDELHVLGLLVPHAMIDGGMDQLDRITRQDLSQASEMFLLLRAYVTQLAALKGGLDARSAGRVGRNLADLVNAMVAEVTLSSPLDLSAYKCAALARVHSFVEEHLDNPELNPDMVSQALRLSPRYINRTLEAEGTSLGRMIWHRRLERIARDLRDPALARRSISMIALARGFNDLSHFSKAFRRRYAMTPRDYRYSQA